MSTEAGTAALIDEARRQIEICNACRYCEGFCAVFPAMTRNSIFSDGDISHLANLCHNCRGCYYSCQYTSPHEFALNVPAALAEVRQDSWERLVPPSSIGRAFHAHGVAIAAALVAGIGLMFIAAKTLAPTGGQGFYAYLGHSAMVGIFLPSFALPLLMVMAGLRAYWREVDAPWPRAAHVAKGLRQAFLLKNLDGGQGQGCNFEKGDRYSDKRRAFHHWTLAGFLLCFASTSVATVMHYGFDSPAPYGLLSLPKLLGVPGGMLLMAGTAGLAILKLKADPKLGAETVWGGEMAFVALLFLVASSGLALYAATGTGLVRWILALHLGAVLAFFLLLPYTKMVHGFFRIAALVADEAKKNAPRA
jgi:citrate/tricarballylate utilization protein